MFKNFLRFAVVALFFGVIAGTLSAKVIDKTIAVVNGDAIMSSDFDGIMVPILEQYKQSAPQAEQTPEKIAELKQKVLNQMIDDKLAKQEAKKNNIKIPKREVDQGINQIKQRFASEADFNAELKKGNLTMSQFEKRIEEQLMVMKLLDQAVKSKTKMPSEESMKIFYSDIQKKMAGKNLGLEKKSEDEVGALAKLFKRAGAEKVRARHILIRADKSASQADKAAALKKIQGVKKELDNGADFGELAKKYSEDPGTRETGGDLGFFSQDDMIPEFAKVAFSLDVGKTSGIVQTDFGYHIIRVEEKKASKKLTYEDLKNDIQEYLFQKEAQKNYEKWMKDLRDKANVKVNPIE